MEIIFVLAWVVCAAICNSQAKKKNLNVGLWTFLGLFFGLFAVVGVLVASPKSAA